MRYLPKSDTERREMLDVIGIQKLEDLFASIPTDQRLTKPLDLPPGFSEYEIAEYFKAARAKTRPATPDFSAPVRICTTGR